MKYNKMIETNETNKNTFLITCCCCILLLLTLCYFGVNSSVIKGTSATTDNGLSLLAPQVDSPGCVKVEYEKCSGEFNYTESNVCWYCPERTVSLNCYCRDSDTGPICTWAEKAPAGYSSSNNCKSNNNTMTLEERYEMFAPQVDNSKYCQKTEYEKCSHLSNYVKRNVCWDCSNAPSVATQCYCKDTDTGELCHRFASDPGGGYKSASSEKCGGTTGGTTGGSTTPVIPEVSVSKTSLSIEAGKVATFTVKSNVAGNFGFSSADASVATVSPASVTVSANEEKTITVTAISDGTTKVNVTFTSSSNSSTVAKTVNVYVSEPQCWQCNSPDTVFYWGISAPSNSTQCQSGWHLSNNNKEQCEAQKIDPMIIVSKTSLSVIQGKEATFSIESSVAGKFDIVSIDTTVATVSPLSLNVVANAINTIKVTGVKAGSSVDVVLTFTPTDTTKYKTSSKTVKVTVNKATSSGDYDPEPTKYTYTATFKVGNGETLNGSSTLTCTSYVSNLCTLGSSYTIPTATKDGHTFTGWDTSTSCSAPLKSNLKMTSRSVTYNACFTANSTNNGNKVDGDGNVTTNSPTGDIVIGVIWFIGIFAIAYVVVNFRRINEK